MLIEVLENRNVIISNDVYGTQYENNATTINFQFPEKYSNFTKKIVFVTDDDGNFSEDIENDSYIIPLEITQIRNMYAYIWLTNGNTEQDFRTKMFKIDFFHSVQNINEISEETPIT